MADSKALLSKSSSSAASLPLAGAPSAAAASSCRLSKSARLTPARAAALARSVRGVSRREKRFSRPGHRCLLRGSTAHPADECEKGGWEDKDACDPRELARTGLRVVTLLVGLGVGKYAIVEPVAAWPVLREVGRVLADDAAEVAIVRCAAACAVGLREGSVRRPSRDLQPSTMGAAVGSQHAVRKASMCTYAGRHLVCGLVEPEVPLGRHDARLNLVERPVSSVLAPAVLTCTARQRQGESVRHCRRVAGGAAHRHAPCW